VALMLGAGWGPEGSLPEQRLLCPTEPTRPFPPLPTPPLQDAQQHGDAEAALAAAQAEAFDLSARLEATQREAADANAALAAARGRTAMLERQWAQAAEEASQLRSEKSGLQSALSAAQQEARALAAQLDEARALSCQLEQAQLETAAATSLLEQMRGRAAMLEKAWASSMGEAQVSGSLVGSARGRHGPAGVEDCRPPQGTSALPPGAHHPASCRCPVQALGPYPAHAALTLSAPPPAAGRRPAATAAAQAGGGALLGAGPGRRAFL
jgi:transposase-like protein